MQTQSYCQDFTQGLKKIQDFATGNFDDLVQRILKNQVSIEELTQQINALEQEQRDFLAKYQEKTLDLLENWFYPIDPIAIDHVTFDSEGRVVLTCGLDASGYEGTYFPTLIRKMRNFILPSNVTNMDYLEEVDGKAGAEFDVGKGEIADLQITSMKRLRRVGDLFLPRTPISCLDSLEEVDIDLVLNDTKVTVLDRLKKVGGEFNIENAPLASLKNLAYAGSIIDGGQDSLVYESLREVEQELDTDLLKPGRFPKLQKVNHAVRAGMLDRKPFDFRSVFPQLTHVGKDRQGTSFFVGSQEVKQQLISLKTAPHPIHFDGDILVI